MNLLNEKSAQLRTLGSIGLLSLMVTACGGGGGGTDPAPPPPVGPTDPERIAAATQTASSNAACGASELPEGFYWEIGDRNGAKASGTVSGTDTPTAGQVIAIASSSKWVYSTYVLQKVPGVRDSDVPFLHFTSGWVYPALPLSAAAKEAVCAVSETVAECAADANYLAAADTRFYYSAGHFQHHAASVMGLGAMHAAELTSEVSSALGVVDFRYLQTNLAGGLNASASGYASFLRKMLRGDYAMLQELGSHKVCASAACSAGAVLSPAPVDEAWQYSLGHWVEDDPVVGDGAFSSAGALGFYPWIDKSKTWYGVVARRAASANGGQGVKSLRCGRLIRQAWITGIPVTSTTPTP